MSCFLEDIDPILKIFKDFQTDIHVFSVPAFSNIFKHDDFQNALIFKKTGLRYDFVFFLYYVMYTGVNKYTNRWFWESWTRPKIPKSQQLWVLGFSQNEIEKL